MFYFVAYSKAGMSCPTETYTLRNQLLLTTALSSALVAVFFLLDQIQFRDGLDTLFSCCSL